MSHSSLAEIAFRIVGSSAALLVISCGSGSDSGAGSTARITVPRVVSGSAGTQAQVASTGQGGQDDFGNGPGTISSTAPTGAGGSTPVGGQLLGCKNLQCQQHQCTNNGKTRITGRVYDPAGKDPLYNVAVFVPNEATSPIVPGVTCDCESLYSGKPVVTTLTDANGNFSLDDAPDGNNIPLVIQIGKWRKQLVIPSVQPCQNNALADKTLTLPRNHMEGDLPDIAVSTGGADTLECLLRRVGVDASEYEPGNMGQGHVHIFQGSGAPPGTPIIPGLGNAGPPPNTSPAAPSSSTDLWSSVDQLKKYDIVLLSCEGDETKNMNQQAMHDYASAGGRVFASHFHYSWFNTGPYAMENLATWSAGPNLMGDINAQVVTTFPKGMALQQWLQANNALTNGELPIQQARHNADVSSANMVSQTWIVSDQSSNPPSTTQYFSFNTPTNAVQAPDGPAYCGRVVYSDLHVGAASNDMPTMPVPDECSNVDLSPQEKALEFMLFDLSSCVIPDNRPPAPPPVVN